MLIIAAIRLWSSGTTQVTIGTMVRITGELSTALPVALTCPCETVDRVRRTALKLAKSLRDDKETREQGFAAPDMLLVELVALFHDMADGKPLNRMFHYSLIPTRMLSTSSKIRGDVFPRDGPRSIPRLQYCQVTAFGNANVTAPVYHSADLVVDREKASHSGKVGRARRGYAEGWRME